MDIRSYFHEMRDILEKKHIYLKQVYELTLKQSEALNANQLRNFIDLSCGKQDIITRINNLDKHFEGIYELTKQSKKSEAFDEVFLKQKDLFNMQQTIGIIQDIVEEIRQLESQNDILYKKLISKTMSSLAQDMSDRQDQISRYKRMSNYKKSNDKKYNKEI